MGHGGSAMLKRLSSTFAKHTMDIRSAHVRPMALEKNHLVGSGHLIILGANSLSSFAD